MKASRPGCDPSFNNASTATARTSACPECVSDPSTDAVASSGRNCKDICMPSMRVGSFNRRRCLKRSTQLAALWSGGFGQQGTKQITGKRTAPPEPPDTVPSSDFSGARPEGSSRARSGRVRRRSSCRGASPWPGTSRGRRGTGAPRRSRTPGRPSRRRCWRRAPIGARTPPSACRSRR